MKFPVIEQLDRSGMSNRQAFFFLLILSFTAVFPRWLTYHEPLTGDTSIFALIGHEWLKGRPLYTDLVDQKPPLLYLTYAFGEVLFGYGHPQSFWLGALFSVATLVPIFLSGRWWRKEPLDGLLAASYWAFLSSDCKLEGNQPQAELFMAAFLSWGFYFSLPKRDHSTPWVFWVLSGVALAIASFYKNTIWGITVAVGMAYWFLPEAFMNRKRRLLANACIWAPTIMAWTSYLLYTMVSGSWPDLKKILFSFNLFYSGSVANNLMTGFFQWNPSAYFLLPVLGLSLFTAYRGLREPNRIGVFFLALLTGTYIGVFSYEYQRIYYYQLWGPALSVGIGWFWAITSSNYDGLKRRIAACLLAFVFILLLVRVIPFWFKSPDEWSYSKYETTHLIDAPIANDLNRFLLPGETIFVFAHHSGIYIDSGRDPGTGVVADVFLRRGPLQEYYTHRAINDLSIKQTEIIVCWNHFEKSEWETNLFILWLRDHYRPLVQDPHPGSMVFLVRKGGRLDRTYPAPASGYGPGPGWANPFSRE
jgi:hypothetical protein